MYVSVHYICMCCGHVLKLQVNTTHFSPKYGEYWIKRHGITYFCRNRSDEPMFVFRHWTQQHRAKSKTIKCIKSMILNTSEMHEVPCQTTQPVRRMPCRNRSYVDTWSPTVCLSSYKELLRFLLTRLRFTYDCTCTTFPLNLQYQLVV